MKPKGLYCPIARTLKIIGERWTILIIRDLLIEGRARFQSLLESLQGISPNTLSARLKRLENAGVVIKKIYQGNPPRAEYVLTKQGEELGSVVSALYDWGKAHTDTPKVK
jgi:DNA-binding HxlR family transcriptional regulator